VNEYIFFRLDSGPVSDVVYVSIAKLRDLSIDTPIVAALNWFGQERFNFSRKANIYILSLENMKLVFGSFFFFFCFADMQLLNIIYKPYVYN
jgi:hypothetical protein